MKKHLLMLSCTMFSIGAFCQSFQWAQSIGGVGSDVGNSTAVDASGNVYTVGSFEGAVDFDPGAGTAMLNSSGGTDIYISKLNPQGNFVWAKSIGSTGADAAYSIGVDASNNLFITGQYEGMVDFDPGANTTNLTSAGQSDIFVIKIDAFGALVWAKSIGGSGSDRGNALAVKGAGDVHITGYYESAVDFDPDAGNTTLTSAGDADVFVLKLTSAGALAWAKSMGGSGKDNGNAIALDATGAVYSTGFFSATADFDPGANVTNVVSAGMWDVYISRLDDGGAMGWVRSCGGVSVDVATAISVGQTQGWVVVAGSFTGTGDFAPGQPTINHTSNGGTDVFVVRMNLMGTFNTTKSFGGPGNETATSVSLDASENVYISGSFEGDVDFDAGVTNYNLVSTGQSDIYLLKWLQSLTFDWAKAFGGAGSDYSTQHIVDAYGSLYVTGSFSNVVDFDPSSAIVNLTSLGGSDIYSLKVCVPPDNAGSITGPTDVCAGSTAGYSIFAVAGATGYSWSFPPGTMVVSGQNTNSITVTFGSDPGSVSVTPNNGCGGVGLPTQTVVNVFALPGFSLQPGTVTVAAGADARFVVTTTSGAGTYKWEQNTGTGFSAVSNGGQFSGADNDSLMINDVTLSQDNYKYRCVVTENGCSDTSEQGTLEVTSGPSGVKDLSKLNSFLVYPNPSKNVVTIETNAVLVGTTYSIMDQAGKKVLSGQLTSQTTEVNISSLANGIYLVKVGEGIHKLVKQ